MPRRQTERAKPIPQWRRAPRNLIRLQDQGHRQRVSSVIFGFSGADRSWNPLAESFISSNHEPLHALDIEAALVAETGEIGLYLQPGSSVGAVPLRSPITHRVVGGVVVRPRFGWYDVGPLLDQIGWTASPKLLEFSLVPGAALEVPPWVLAGPILQRFRALADELRAGFRVSEAIRQSPRGQILWPRYVQEQLTHGMYHLLPCRFSDRFARSRMSLGRDSE